MFIFAVYTLNISFTRGHELAHVAIFKHYGCENASYRINYLVFSGISQCNNHNAVPEQLYPDMAKLHMLNEIVGYNVSNIGNCILVGFLFLGLAILVAIDRRREGAK